jgi:hypothetical protein
MVNGKPANVHQVKHYSDFGFDPKFCDIAESDLASYCEHPVDILEPLPDEQTEYRRAALAHLRVLLRIDECMSNSESPRLAWITVAITFDLTSIRDLTETEIANQLGVSPATLRCATAKFREMVGLDSAGSIQAIPTRA